MAKQRTTMRKIRELMRLRYEQQLSHRQIGTSLNCSASTVSEYMARIKLAKLEWPQPSQLDDDALYELLFPEKKYPLKGGQRLPLPDFTVVHQELKRKGVTKLLLWYEYRERCPLGHGYSWFCQRYAKFTKKLNPTLRQTHKAGEKIFVDYAGVTIPWIEQETGETHQAQIFVSVLGASNYTYVEATASQSLPDWIGSHVRTFKFFGGVPSILVPDNLKSGVQSASWYDPDINPTYQELADFYKVAVVPTRVAKPKDKAKVEVGVQGIERWVLAPLRHHTFFSVAEINEAIAPLLKAYNERSFQSLSGNRLSQFKALDKPALNPLPTNQYEYAEWKKAKVGMDYHVAINKHYYSVSHRYIRQAIDIRLTITMVECFYKNKRIALHTRQYKPGYTTIKEHMPKSHQAYVEWTPKKLQQRAKKVSPNCIKLIEAIIASKPMPQQAYRSCLGVLRLGDKYGHERLENAAIRALRAGALRYKNIASILSCGLDKQPLPQKKAKSLALGIHANVRGSDYYH